MSNQLTWRTIIVGGKGVHNRLLLPRVFKSNAKGERLFTKGGEPMLEYASAVACCNQPTKDWATKMDDLNATEKSVKDVFNEVKSLLRASKYAAVFYHSGRDPCSLSKHNHYHLLITRESGKDFDKDYRWRAIRKAAKAAQEHVVDQVTVTSQKVRDIDALTRYLSHSPRIFMGTNCKLLFTCYKNSVNQPLTEDNPNWVTEDDNLDELLGEADAQWENDGWGNLDLLTESEFEEFGRKKKATDWDDDGTDNFEPPQKLAKRGKPAETTTTRLIEICFYLMRRLGTTDRGRLRQLTDKHLEAGRPEAHNWLARIRNINYSRMANHIYINAAEEYRHYMRAAPLKHLFLRSWMHCGSTVGFDRPFIPLDTSIGLFFDWMIHNGWNMPQFVANLFTVLEKRGDKKNTMFLWGKSNNGKSVMFAHPIELLMQSVGRIVQLNTTSNFIFETCIDRRLISIEECSIPPGHVEECKKIMGGELCQIHVKNVREGGLVQPTPVIATSNVDPWLLVPEHREAIINRIHLYQCIQAFMPLEAWTGFALDPRVYVMLYWQYKGGGHYEELLDEVKMGVLFTTIEAQARALDVRPQDDPSAINPYDKHPRKEPDGKCLEGYIDELPVYNPFKVHARLLGQWIGGLQVHHFPNMPGARDIGEFWCYIKFVNFYVGVNIGYSVPDYGVSEDLKDVCCVDCYLNRRVGRPGYSGDFLYAICSRDSDNNNHPERRDSCGNPWRDNFDPTNPFGARKLPVGAHATSTTTHHSTGGGHTSTPDDSGCGGNGSILPTEGRKVLIEHYWTNENTEDILIDDIYSFNDY